MFQDPEIYIAALDNLPIGVYMVDANLRVVFWNHGAEMITGYLAQDVLGRRCREKFLIDLDESNPVACGEACQLTDSMREGKPREADVLLRHRSGHRIPVHVRATPLRDSTNKIVGATECFEENRFRVFVDSSNTEKKAEMDEVTGLPNIEKTMAKLQEAFQESAEHRLPLCVLVAEVDQLQNFQQVQGKDAVAAARAVVAHTLTNALRPQDVVGCWEQNRFLGIVKNCDSAVLHRVGERVRKMESYSGVEWWGDELPVTVSIGGTSMYEGDDLTKLVDRAMTALQQSVNAGGNCVTVFQNGDSKA